MKLPQKNPLEWAVFTASVALLLVVTGLLAADALDGVGAPVAVIVTPGDPITRGSQVEVPVLVENHGDEAAEDVLVQVTVRQASVEHRTELTVPLLPRHSAEEARIVVPYTGAIESVRAGIVSYRAP